MLQDYSVVQGKKTARKHSHKIGPMNNLNDPTNFLVLVNKL